MHCMIERTRSSPYYVTSAYKHAAEKLHNKAGEQDHSLADVQVQEWVVAVQGVIDRHRNHREPNNADLLQAVRQGLGAPQTLKISRGFQSHRNQEHNAHLLEVTIIGENNVSFSSQLKHYAGQRNDTYYRSLLTQITSTSPPIENWEDSWAFRPRLNRPSTHINDVTSIREGDYGYERMMVITSVLGAMTTLMNDIGLVFEQK